MFSSRADAASATWVFNRPLTLVVSFTAAVALTLTAAPTHATTTQPDPDLSDQQTVVVEEVTEAIDELGLEEAVDNVDVDLPYSAEHAASLLTQQGTLELTVPGVGEGQPLESGVLFDGAATDTSVVVDSLASGLRALVHIDSPDAPERFEFELGGDVASLRLDADGGVSGYNANGDVVASAPAPWAVDATGAVVPTRFEVDGTTLYQIVEHRGGDWVYGITADPSFWAVAKCVAAITWVVGSSIFAVAKITKIKGAIKALGGIKETAKLLLGATSKTEKAKALGAAGASAAAYFLGIDTIVNNC